MIFFIIHTYSQHTVTAKAEKVFQLSLESNPVLFDCVSSALAWELPLYTHFHEVNFNVLHIQNNNSLAPWSNG